MQYRSTLLALVSSALLGIAGCGHGYVGVSVGPPVAPYVVGPVGMAPGPNYVWTDGYWNLEGGNWRWRQGAWVIPPRGRRHWEGDRWERHGNGYRFHRGHWRR